MKKNRRHKSKRLKLNGYLRIGFIYISLAFIVFVLIAGFAFGTMYMTVLHPVIMASWYERQSMPEFSIDSPYLAGYTGKARLVLPDGSLLYEGDVDAAAVSGNGKLYRDGILLYDGGFLENMYSGRGTLYAADGSVSYTGDFAENLPHGFGTLYFTLDEESCIYSGAFDSGERSGEGTLIKGGALIYKGEFSAGLYSGDGTEYDPNTGHPIFKGKYLDGGRMEAGTKYDARGVPIVDTPANPDPINLLDSTYIETLTGLSESSADCREQAIDGARLIINEAGGVIYVFSLNGSGFPDTLSEIYLCGLATAGGYVVGSHMAGTAELPVETPEIGERELFALSLSNAFRGTKTQADKLVSIISESGGSIVTAFCEVAEEPLDLADEATEDFPDAGIGKYAKVLPGDPEFDDPLEDLPDGTPMIKAGRIVFLKVERPVSVE